MWWWGSKASFSCECVISNGIKGENTHSKWAIDASALCTRGVSQVSDPSPWLTLNTPTIGDLEMRSFIKKKKQTLSTATHTAHKSHWNFYFLICWRCAIAPSHLLSYSTWWPAKYTDVVEVRSSKKPNAALSPHRPKVLVSLVGSVSSLILEAASSRSLRTWLLAVGVTVGLVVETLPWTAGVGGSRCDHAFTLKQLRLAAAPPAVSADSNGWAASFRHNSWCCV